jgi:hypothetical protein
VKLSDFRWGCGFVKWNDVFMREPNEPIYFEAARRDHRLLVCLLIITSTAAVLWCANAVVDAQPSKQKILQAPLT